MIGWGGIFSSIQYSKIKSNTHIRLNLKYFFVILFTRMTELQNGERSLTHTVTRTKHRKRTHIHEEWRDSVNSIRRDGRLPVKSFSRSLTQKVCLNQDVVIKNWTREEKLSAMYVCVCVCLHVINMVLVYRFVWRNFIFTDWLWGQTFSWSLSCMRKNVENLNLENAVLSFSSVFLIPHPSMWNLNYESPYETETENDAIQKCSRWWYRWYYFQSN